MRLPLALTLICCAAACGSPASTALTTADASQGGTSSQDASPSETAADAITGDVDAASQSDAAGPVDVPGNPGADTAAVTDTTPADGKGADANAIGDVPSNTDAANPSDSANPGDATAVADAGAGTDAVSTTDAGYPALPLCQAVCANVGKTQCPNDEPYDVCVAGCSAGVAGAKTCVAEMIALLDCGKLATLTCDAQGEAFPTPCQSEYETFKDCAKDPGPGADPCAITCGAGAGPGGGAACGCEANCTGMIYKLSCDSISCTCSYNGKDIDSFPQGDLCASDLATTFKFKCMVP